MNHVLRRHEKLGIVLFIIIFLIIHVLLKSQRFHGDVALLLTTFLHLIPSDEQVCMLKHIAIQHLSLSYWYGEHLPVGKVRPTECYM